MPQVRGALVGPPRIFSSDSSKVSTEGEACPALLLLDLSQVRRAVSGCGADALRGRGRSKLGAGESMRRGPSPSYLSAARLVIPAKH